MNLVKSATEMKQVSVSVPASREIQVRRASVDASCLVHKIKNTDVNTGLLARQGKI